MKKVFIMLIILVAVSFASMTKIYIGNENDQVIIGIETIAVKGPEETTSIIKQWLG